ncbi:MAG TPA: HD domain-containing protein [Firmicutes bacterium]|jgi:predicted HD superfamily hydrolase involved in NAD metabolism|nr:HD domain-containing protein [Bacillota bacterium]
MDLIEFVRNSVTKERFEHSQRVAIMARKLAKAHNLDEDEAFVAGLLHDTCREIKDEELITLAREYGIEVGDLEQQNPVVLHGKVAAAVLGEELNLSHSIQEAISYHVTGHPKMGQLARIVFLADKLEDARDYPGVDRLRVIALNDYNRALVEVINSSILYLIDKDLPIHQDTIALRNDTLPLVIG